MISSVDLSDLVATTSINCKVLDFHIKATGLYYMVDSNLKALSSYGIIWNLNNKLRSLKAQRLFMASIWS